MNKHYILSTCTALLMALTASSEACTGLKLTAKDGQTVHGRTLEFGVDVKPTAVVIPRDYAFESTTPKGKGLSYKAKYAAVGMVCFDQILAMDGINEKGLSVGTFYFPGFAGYTDTTAENQSHSLSSIDFPNYILTQFATLDEVKTGIKNILIAPTIVKEWGTTPPPFHYIVYDKSGNSLVIEPVNGQLQIFDNPLGTLTNSPNFEWHMTNLRNYINLSPKNVPPLRVDGLVLAPFGQGSGLVGMPGDFTPPSRFVRASIYAITAEPTETANDAVFQTFHILNQFDIPVGVAREVKDGIVYSDYTIATVVRDSNNLKYFFKSYTDQTIRAIDLKAFDKNAKEIKKTSTVGQQTFVDISKDFK